MEDQKSISISIPKPCHEDWNKMAPNEKGAFCGKCAKTVVDFTKKTADEISSFLIAQSGKKICGRFMSDQLDEPLKPVDIFIPLSLLPKKLSFSKAFAFALFIAFGTTLFSCSTQQGEVVGKIAAVNDTIVPVKKGEVMQLTGDTVYNVAAAPGMLPVKRKNPKPECAPLKGDVDVRPMLGEVAAPVIDTATIKKDTTKNLQKIGKLKISDR
ncbi:MAG: hypothetical protein JWO09_2412 [Bacteroidetes bacterium]|nr:hypothetical protein [Bacteroidota bacterium]